MQGYLLVLYLGGAFYYAFTYKRMEDGATLGLYAFLYLFGGILFHLISETKSQYTLPYIYLQIPMIAAGYIHMSQKLNRYLSLCKSHPRMAF
ncbi:tryptophan permease [Streptococcus vestibularis]|uniref:tryptophan permease n=2 Tax=Streptococcus vestibularis TaxID=1343 RepID=UPI0026724D11|nr:tryptophan permease [Streptococcus vestibularis]